MRIGFIGEGLEGRRSELWETEELIAVHHPRFNISNPGAYSEGVPKVPGLLEKRLRRFPGGFSDAVLRPEASSWPLVGELQNFTH